MLSDHLKNQQATIVMNYIEHSSNSIYVVIDRNFYILDCNHAFKDFFELSQKPIGNTITKFMATKDDVLILEEGCQTLSGFHKVPIMMATKKISTSGFTFSCLFDGELFHLFGEKLIAHENKIIQEFSLLSNQLNNSNRDLFKKNMELEALMYNLEEAHAAKDQILSHYMSSEKELHRIKEAAEQSTLLKSEFLASMSHEIRTPMNVIIGMADLVLHSNLDSEQKEYVEMINNSANSLLLLINDILDFSKIEAGQMELREEDYIVADEIKKIISLFKLQAREKSLTLKASIDESVPYKLHGDLLKVGQILINLISNAIKFTEQGGITVSVMVNQASNKLSLSVIDTGDGIPPEKIENLFNKYTQLIGANTRKYQGTGLGLSISKKLVELMGGSIGATSELGKGSTFFFEIPLVIAQAQIHEADASEHNRDEQSETYSGDSLLYKKTKVLEILVVEDKRMNQRLVKALLEYKGWLVTFAMNGQEALDVLKEREFDAILMDMQMPVMDGLQATEIIRKEEAITGKHTPIIAMTANVMQEDMDQCVEVGMDGYVSKPIDREKLYLAIEQAVERFTKEVVDEGGI